MKKRLPLAGLLALASLTPAFAETQPPSPAAQPAEEGFALEKYLSLEGYVAASLAAVDPSGAPRTDTLFDSGANNLDSGRLSLLGNYENFSGKVSLFYVPDSSAGGGTNDAKVLDAYVSYAAEGFTVTGGKFLSYLGYEAFEAVYLNQLTWGYASGIPAYHTGAKLDYATDTFSVGFSVTDSLYPAGSLLQKGDNTWSDGLGYELAFTYTGIEKLTLFLGGGYDDDDSAVNDYVLDFWATYEVSDKLTLGGEISYYDEASTSFILTANYAFTDKISTLFRASAQRLSESGNTWGSYWTVSPTYHVSENLLVRGEISYSTSDDAPGGPIGAKGAFYGAQVLFKF